MLPHFCATGACIHVMIIALYICQRNILIVSAFFDAVALCISSQDKCERTVACYIAGCSEAVLKCKYCKHKGRGYTLPKSIVNKMRFNKIRVFFIGTNILTFAKFKEWDPEMGSSNGEKYPLAKTFTLGLTVNI